MNYPPKELIDTLKKHGAKVFIINKKTLKVNPVTVQEYVKINDFQDLEVRATLDGAIELITQLKCQIS